jgi:hypothetical protein
MERVKILVAIGLLLLSTAIRPDQHRSKPTMNSQTPGTSVSDSVVQGEIVIEGLRVPLAVLSKSVANLRLPDERGRSVLAENVIVTDLVATPDERREPLLDLGFERINWPVSDDQKTEARQDVLLWEQFLSTVDFFHHFKFYNIRGKFDGPLTYRTDSGFRGAAQLRSGRLVFIEGKLGLDWQGTNELVGDAEETRWRITRFETRGFDLTEGDEPLFADVGDIAFDSEVWKKAIASPRNEAIVKAVLEIRTGTQEMQGYLDDFRRKTEIGTSGSMDATQSVVVDVDGDGFDDLYLTGAYGPSALFRNNGDGTFTDQTKARGLAFDNVLSATFADLDNDGDVDLLLSRFDRESATRYLVNESGAFVDRTDTLPKLPNWVLPISVTDYNNDGLLDVYLSTYVNAYLPPVMLANEKKKVETGSYTDKFPFMDDAVAHTMLKRNREQGDPLAKAFGPPNWLLENQGNGMFKRATNAGDVEGQFNTLGAAWTDMDLDGDMDLYLVSEGGPNELKRNNGDGTFTDVADAVSGEIGFGMGLGVGDYDNDGRTDMYVTNMYSKAGLRIAEQLGSSEMVVQSARGNTLLRNTGAGFIRTSSADGTGVQVETADFGWGGGFADLNNDGFLDLYVPAGQQSMPQEVATIGDS